MLLDAMRAKLESEPRVTVDYAEIVDANSFEPVRAIRGNCYALIAATVGGTRLIDNAYIEAENENFRIHI
jgi:pantothenate synthetase